jgi:hypothetical protein
LVASAVIGNPRLAMIAVDKIFLTEDFMTLLSSPGVLWIPDAG